MTMQTTLMMNDLESRMAAQWEQERNEFLEALSDKGLRYPVTDRLIDRTHSLAVNQDIARVAAPFYVVDQGVTGDCLVWLHKLTDRGYGVVRINGEVALTHHLTYLDLHLYLPDNCTVRESPLQHLCRRPYCLQASHIQEPDLPVSETDAQMIFDVLLNRINPHEIYEPSLVNKAHSPFTDLAPYPPGGTMPTTEEVECVPKLFQAACPFHRFVEVDTLPGATVCRLCGYCAEGMKYKYETAASDGKQLLIDMLFELAEMADCPPGNLNHKFVDKLYDEMRSAFVSTYFGTTEQQTEPEASTLREMQINGLLIQLFQRMDVENKDER